MRWQSAATTMSSTVFAAGLVLDLGQSQLVEVGTKLFDGLQVAPVSQTQEVLRRAHPCLCTAGGGGGLQQEAHDHGQVVPASGGDGIQHALGDGALHEMTRLGSECARQDSWSKKHSARTSKSSDMAALMLLSASKKMTMSSGLSFMMRCSESTMSWCMRTCSTPTLGFRNVADAESTHSAACHKPDAWSRRKSPAAHR